MLQLSFRVWGHNFEKVTALIAGMPTEDNVVATTTLEDNTNQSDIIRTATSSTTHFLQSGRVQPRAHLTAVDKQQLGVTLVARTDLLIVDFSSQCLDHREVSHTAERGLIKTDDT